MSELALLGGQPIHAGGWPRWPIPGDLEEAALLRVLRSGAWWQNSMGEALAAADGGPQPVSEVGHFEQNFAATHGCRYGVCAANGTVTLEVALRAAGVAPGDEVIVPPYTFVATATAPLMVGAVPVFVDIEPDTCNLDPERLRAAITPRTRAIIPVHFAGLPAPLDDILAIARESGLRVIEDCAHAHGAAYQGRMCGSLGDCGSFSFQGSKNITSGEGGIITTQDRELAERATSYVWGGRALGGAWYGHVNLGSNLRLTEFQAALLSAQLQRLPEWFAQRATAAAHLNSCIETLRGVAPMRPPTPGSTHAFHLYLFRYTPEAFDGLSKARFVEALRAEGVPASAGYDVPLYRNPVFREQRFWPGGYPFVPGVHAEPIDYGAFAEQCPAAERACAQEIVWLPQSLLLAGRNDVEDVARAIAKIQAHARELT